MKDYSMNLEERKDFIEGYVITDDGQILVKFAKGELLPLPYNKENETIILDKMEKQLENSDKIENKLHRRVLGYSLFSGLVFILGVFPLMRILNQGSISTLTAIATLWGSASIIFGGLAIKNKLKLNDLRKNIRFMEIKDTLNENLKSEKNTLINVSSKTKGIIKDFPENVEIFNINSFNFVPFNDLEQIVENVERNERFGFNYEKQDAPQKGFVKKRVR